MSKNNTGHKCTFCDETYNKKDFDVCPHCAGNGGGRTPRVWKPSKREKKAFIKKNKHLLN